MKLSVTQVRVIVIVTNLALTLAVGGHAAYRFFNPDYASDQDTAHKKNVRRLMNLKGSFKRRTQERPSNEIMKVRGVGDAIDPAAPPPPEEIAEGELPGEEEAPAEGEVEEGGPLDDLWEYVTPLIFAPGSNQNRAVLRKKGSVRKTPARRRSTARNNRSKTKKKNPRVTRRGANTHKTLKLFQKWVVDEEKGPTVWAVSITPEEFIYEVEGTWRKYSLKRPKNEIYVVNDDGVIEGVQPPKEEDPEDPDAEEAEKPKKYFAIGATMPTLREEYDRRKETPPENDADSDDDADAAAGNDKNNRNARTSGREYRMKVSDRNRPKSKEEQARELRSTLREIKSKKMSDKDREALKEIDEVLSGKRKK